MFNIVPQRYTQAKWVAYVTPEDKAFTFKNGVKVRSLLELKQALAVVPEDVIADHIKNNDIVNWVEFVVEDKDLAAELKKCSHRWGLIVNLERQMMRTLNTPDYVAKRWLKTSPLTFTFVSGETVGSQEELSAALGKVSDQTVIFHQERVPNDISKWVMDVLGDYELADLLEDATNREQMKRFVDDHLAMLKEAAE